MSRRRVVRVDARAFDQIDAQLGEERGPGGEPSSGDFIITELPTILDQLAEGFDLLPESVVGVPGLRVIVGVGTLVHAFAVHGLLVDDDTIEVVAINIDVDGR